MPPADPAFGQAGWPDRLLRIVVPFAPGSFTDVSARLVANELTEQLGQSVIVENRGGAGGTAGTTAVVRAAPDGYTLLLTDTSLSISPGLYPNLPYDPVRDLAQISRIADSPSILLVRPGLGPRTLAELVALAKQKPGEITFGSGGPGSSAHLAMELLLNVAGIRALHVPFRGVAAAIAEVVAGRVDMAIASLASGLAHVQAGTLLGLGVSGSAAQPVAAAGADIRRGRPAALRHVVLVGDRGAGRHAAADHRAAQPRDRARLRAAAAARRVPQAGRRRRHLDAGGDDAASRARDRGLARGDHARQRHDPVAPPTFKGESR